jgi:hypothetical protein
VLATCVARHQGRRQRGRRIRPVSRPRWKLAARRREGVIAYVDGDDLLPRLDLQAKGVELRHLDKGLPSRR